MAQGFYPQQEGILTAPYLSKGAAGAEEKKEDGFGGHDMYGGQSGGGGGVVAESLDPRNTSSESIRSGGSNRSGGGGGGVLQRAREYERAMSPRSHESQPPSSRSARGLKSPSKSKDDATTETTAASSRHRGTGVSQGSTAVEHPTGRSAPQAGKQRATGRGGGGEQQQQAQSRGRAAQGAQLDRNGPAPAPAAGAAPGRDDKVAAADGANNNNAAAAVVTPELLVDALSGHEDGLLAIAERLMEHYDSGYDAMGEAIIDAFADVQKLFQHVVEAAHMEGAAFEAQRREEEEMKRRSAEGGDRDRDREEYDPALGVSHAAATPGAKDGAGGAGGGPQTPNGAGGGANNANSGPSPRHDEFIDQDVRDVLLDAVRRGQSLRSAGRHMECYALYERACHSASALLPVDSDHRGRLQLSVARAESMGPDRACAILKYAMDDVLRSGLSATQGGGRLPDPSQRGDCVLDRPKPRPMSLGRSVEDEDDRSLGSSAKAPGGAVVLQSSEEALASLVEEMKEVMSAPVYEGAPLQDVASRFWDALGEAQRSSVRNEEKLEQKLGELKAEFLIQKMEWEEKLSTNNEELDRLQHKYQRLKEETAAVQSPQYLDQARSRLGQMDPTNDQHPGGRGNNSGGGLSVCGGSDFHLRDRVGGGDGIPGAPGDGGDSAASPRFSRVGTGGLSGANSVASFGSGLAQHAKSLVGAMSCVGVGTTNRAGGGVGGAGAGASRSGSSSRRGGRPRRSPSPTSSAGGSRRTPRTSRSRNNSSSREQRYPTHGLGANDI